MDSSRNIDAHRPRGGKRKGFSLVELMIAMTEGSIVMALVLGILTSSVIVGTSVGNYSDLSAQSRIAMTRFESDLRSASGVTSGSNDSVTANILTDVNLLNGNVTTDTVTYQYSGNKLFRNGAILMSDVKSCRISYFDSSDRDISGTPALARKVMLTATLSRTNLGRTNTDYLVSAVVVLRAFKTPGTP